MSEVNEFEGTGGTGGEPGGTASRPDAYCQNCGKPLTSESKRVVGPAVYCEPCLAARLGGFAGAPAGQGAYGQSAGGNGWQWGWAAGQAWGQNPGPNPGPNPGLAALLGLIPGVGAMYNEQYGKGIAHLVIFAVLVLFTHVSDFFIVFVLGWIAYMSIEAHHTARARRDGTPMPNPFGLNDIEERMGFGKAWPAGPGVGTVARDAAAAAAAAAEQFRSVSGGFGRRAAGAAAAPADPAAAAGASWGAPVDAYPVAGAAAAPPYGAGGTAGYTSGYGGGPVPGYGAGYGPGYGPGYASGYEAAYGAAYAQPGYGPPTPAAAQNVSADVGVPPGAAAVPAINRFPTGAIWLIGLGTIFLLGTTGIFRGFRGLALLGVLLVGAGTWTFVRRMAETGVSLADDGTPLYRLRLLRALSGSIWLVVLGVLILLDSFGWLRWENNWPWLIILAGVLMILKRAAYQSAYPAQYGAPYAGGYGAPPAAQPVPAAGTAGASAIVPAESGGLDVQNGVDDAGRRGN